MLIFISIHLSDKITEENKYHTFRHNLHDLLQSDKTRILKMFSCDLSIIIL